MPNGTIDLGTAVCLRVTQQGNPVSRLSRVDGVVIEVVSPRQMPSSSDCGDSGRWMHRTRYIVQCNGWRTLVIARDLEVVAW